MGGGTAEKNLFPYHCLCFPLSITSAGAKKQSYGKFGLASTIASVLDPSPWSVVHLRTCSKCAGSPTYIQMKAKNNSKKIMCLEKDKSPSGVSPQKISLAHIWLY